MYANIRCSKNVFLKCKISVMMIYGVKLSLSEKNLQPNFSQSYGKKSTPTYIY